MLRRPPQRIAGVQNFEIEEVEKIDLQEPQNEEVKIEMLIQKEGELSGENTFKTNDFDEKDFGMQTQEIAIHSVRQFMTKHLHGY